MIFTATWSQKKHISLLLRVYAPVTPVIAMRPHTGATVAELSLLHKYKHTAVWQKGLREKKEQHNGVKKINGDTQPQIR